jgi:hypothetical protein
MDSAERDYIRSFLAAAMLPAKLRAPRSTREPWSRERVRDSSKPMPRLTPVMKATGLEVDMMEKISGSGTRLDLKHLAVLRKSNIGS